MLVRMMKNIQVKFNMPIRKEWKFAVSACIDCRGLYTVRLIASLCLYCLDHSATHPHFSNLTHAQIDTEIELVETYLHRVIGAVPR